MLLKKAQSLLGFVALLATTMLPHTNAREIVGGYNPVQDYEDPLITTAAQIAFLELFLMEPEILPFKFMSPIIEGEGDKEAFVPKIVSGIEQVVAGLNLRLTLMVVKVNPSQQEEICQGGMDVQMFVELDNTMKVTEWGDEYSCEEVEKLLEFRLIEEEEKEEEEDEEDEDEFLDEEDEEDEFLDEEDEDEFLDEEDEFWDEEDENEFLDEEDEFWDEEDENEFLDEEDEFWDEEDETMDEEDEDVDKEDESIDEADEEEDEGN